jgi:predicted ATP-grasp superfamily ATP-dependent carboligase
LTIPVLLVASVPDWIGTARFPKALRDAGFSVTLLAPPNALAAKSRYVDRVEFFPPQLTIYEWVHSLAATVRTANPRLIVPCDDLTTRLLHSIVLAAPSDLKAKIQVELGALIRESLGDPAYYEPSVDKVRLPPLAASLGVRVIPWVEARNFSDVAAFAASHGYPVVLKAATGAGGEGVVICREASQAANAFERLRLHREQDSPDASQLIVVQEYIPGETIGRPAVGWNGRELAGITRQFVVKNPPETGPGSVVRFYCEPEARVFSDALARGLGMRGFFAAQFIVHARTHELYLLEISRRVTPGHHSGSLVGVDLCAALYAALTGAPSKVPPDLPSGLERTVAQFPQEWLRDPQSAYLRDYPLDAPWGDPDLLRAMIAMRKELAR